MTDTTGLTKDAGWEVGVRQTIDTPLEYAWRYLTGSGLPLWLGDIDSVPHTVGSEYATRDGVHGQIRGYAENSKIRLTWHPADWPHETTVQLTVKEAATGTTVAIHHERLADREERRMMLGHWKAVIASIASALT